MPISTIGQNGLNAPLSLTSPALGTPSSLVLTNATGLPQAGLGTNVVGNGPAFSAYLGSNQNVSGSTWIKVQCNSTDFDTAGVYNTSTYRFTPNVAGYYQVNFSINQVANGYLSPAIYKNGSIYKAGSNGSGAVNNSSGSCIVYLNGSTDYIELYGNTGTTSTWYSGSPYTYFNGCLIRSA
jgi:hypothetical protein